MKIIYLIAGTYRPAGMERVLANKVNWFAERGNDLVVVTTDQCGRDHAFPFHPSVRFVDLRINYEENNGGSFADKLIHFPFKQIRHRRALQTLLESERTDVVVSMFCNDASFLPSIKDGSKKVLEIHFSRFKRLQYGRRGIWKLADRLRSMMDLRTVRRFDKFVVLTEEDKSYWGDIPGMTVIPNARTFRPSEPARLDAKTVIAVGRYTAQKDFGKLLQAWRIVLDKVPGWNLWIVGDGEERSSLESQIETLGIGPSVRLGKAADGMDSVYSGASILALSSRYEGLPMVLLEAQAYGLPIVSFECKCGPKDVVTDGVDGFLVQEGDVQAMADKLVCLMSDDELRHRMGAAAFAASDRFDEAKIMQRWEMLFERL